MENKINFLDEKGFIQVDNIEELKTSRGIVEFYEKYEKDYGKFSKITTPDLRYFWDESILGLHINDQAFNSLNGAAS